jgi:hypothetical protein
VRAVVPLVVAAVPLGTPEVAVVAGIVGPPVGRLTVAVRALLAEIAIERPGDHRTQTTAAPGSPGRMVTALALEFLSREIEKVVEHQVAPNFLAAGKHKAPATRERMSQGLT